MKHVMIDIETLGIKPGSAILEISAATFTLGEGGPLDWFGVEIDLLSSLACGLVTDRETAAWHLKQNTVAHLRGRPLRESAIRLAGWLAERGCVVWAWGMDFERAMLEAAFAAVGLGLPWDFYHGRDARTIWDLAFPGVKHPPRKHTAREDVGDQIRDLNAAVAKLKGGKGE